MTGAPGNWGNLRLGESKLGDPLMNYEGKPEVFTEVYPVNPDIDVIDVEFSGRVPPFGQVSPEMARLSKLILLCRRLISFEPLKTYYPPVI